MNQWEGIEKKFIKARSAPYGKQPGHPKRRVVQIDPATGQPLKVFESIAQASKSTGASQGAISLCANGKTKSALGFHWKFEE